MNQSDIERTKGSQSEIGMMYQYGVTAYLAGGLSASNRVEDYVIYSSEESAGKFDDVIAKVKLKDEEMWYLSLIQVKFKEKHRLNVSDNIQKKSKDKAEYFLSDYIRSFNEILDNVTTTCRKDIPTENIRCGIFCNNQIQLPVYIRNECTFLLNTSAHKETNEINQILLPFGVDFWKFRCEDLQGMREYQRFFDTCMLCLNQPNYNQINKSIQDACRIDNAKDIINYVKDYFNTKFLFAQGLTKKVFDVELQAIRLNSFIPPVTPLLELVEDGRLDVWDRLTLCHDLTIIHNNDDSEVERCLYACLLRRLNMLLKLEVDWLKYEFTNKELEDEIAANFINYSTQQGYRCWVNLPNTLKGLMTEVWKYGELPLVLRMGAEFKIFEDYSHLKRNYILIDDLTKLSDKIAKSKLKIFSCVGDIADPDLKAAVLDQTTVSLQGRLQITLKDLLDDDEQLLSTFTAAHVIGMMKERTAYVKEEYLAGTKNLAFIVHDDNYREIKICHDSPEIGSNARIYSPRGKLEQCFTQVENDPNFQEYKICQLQWIKHRLKLVRHDRYKFVCCFVDQHGEPLYNSEDNKSVPVIGQIVILDEHNYVPRCLTKSTLSPSYFTAQERRICLLSGDVESLQEGLEYEDVDIDSDEICLTEKKTYFIRVKEDERQRYWSKLSDLGCPIFDVRIIKGEMQIVRIKGSKNLGPSISYKGERITQQVLFEEIKRERDNIIIITGEAGVGKSTLLKSLCNSCDSRYYILLYDLINFQICLHENENPLGNPLDFIFKSFHAGVSKRYNEFLLALCKKNRFILMLDSFDEIISTCEKQVIDFIRQIIDTDVQIVIASRLKTSGVLLDKFDARTIKVDPLSDEDYVKNWQLSPEAFANVSMEFRVNPLYVNMLKMISVSREELPQVTKLTLYEKVVNIKIGSWLKRNNRVMHDSETDRTVSLLERVALVAMFGREEIEDGLRWQCDKSIADCTKYGIVIRFDDGAHPLFYHYTFVEYFVGLWIFKSMHSKLYRGFAKYLYKRLFDEGKMYALNVISEDIPLHRAILQTNVDEMEQILEVEAPNCWECTDRLGRSPLHAAIISCGTTHNLDAAYSILKKVMELTAATRPTIMEKCDLIMNWDWTDYIQAKILQYGCSYKTLPMVEKYLQQHKRNNSVFPLKRFQLVFKEALGFLSSDIISQLLQLQNLNNRKFCGFQQNGSNRKFSTNGFKLEGELTTLHIASIYANLPLMENLIRDKFDVNIIDKFDCTPLHYISMGSSASHINGLKLLLRNGAHVDLKHPTNRNNIAPLSIAVFAGNTEAVRILLENGANPNVRDRNLDTPLHTATRKGSYDIVECLLDYNGNPNLKNRNGKTVLDVAVVENNENIVLLLKERSGNVADMNANDNSHSLLTISAKTRRMINSIEKIEPEVVKIEKSNDDEDPSFFHYDYCKDFHNIDSYLNQEDSNPLSLLSILNEININLNSMNLSRLLLKHETFELIFEMSLNSHEIQDEDGCTLLHLVAGEGDASLTEVLLEKQADIDIQDRLGYTPLHYASMKNHLNVATLLLSSVGKGADPNIKDENGDTPLHLSVENNYANMTRLLLKNRADSNIQNNDGRTPLYLAIVKGNLSIVKLLLDNNAKVLIFDNNGLTPLHYAAMKGNLNVLKLLLERGAVVDIVENNDVLPLICAIHQGKIETVTTLIVEGGACFNLSDKNGNLPLHVAVDRKNIAIARFLLDRGAEVNAANKDGITPLYCATYKKHIDMIDLLLERGADINVRNQNLETPLHCAVATTRLDVVERLLDSKSDPDLQDNRGKTPLHFATTNGYVDIVRSLIAHCANIYLTDEDGTTPLHCAVYTGRNEIVKLLIEAGAVVDVSEKSGKTPLYIAVEEGNFDLVKLLMQKQPSLINVPNDYNRTPLHCAFVENHIDIATFLLDKGAAVDIRDKNGDTPLHLAVKQEDADVVVKLIENGANVDAVNKDDATPLYYAAQEGYLDVTRLLLNREAEINVRDYRGNTALHAATIEANTDIVKLLMMKGADANIRNNDRNAPLHYATERGQTNIVRLLLNGKTDADLTGRNDNTALHTATGQGYTYIVRILLEKGAHPSMVNQNRCTPLHYAIEEGYSDIVRLLLDGNSSANVRNKWMDTPLHIAVNKGHVDNVTMLLNNGANVNFDDGNGATPLHSATNHGRIDIAKLLLDKRGNPNSQNDDGDTPLHLSLRQNRGDIFDLLMEKGGELSVRNQIGLTPLDYAAFHGRLGMVKAHLEAEICEKLGNSLLCGATIGKHEDFISELLEKGADLNGGNENGVTPLHCAAYQEDTDLTKFLLNKGAQINSRDKFENTPLHIAVNKTCTPLMKLLLDSEADVNAGNGNGVNPLHIAAYKGDINILTLLLTVKNANIDAQDHHHGNTALHICAEAGHAEIFRLLLERGANPSFYNKEGVTPFHYAAAKGHINVIEASSLDAEILMNILDVNDDTLLHTAASYGRDSILNLLIIRDGVDVNVLNQYRSTPLHFAVYSNHLSSVQLLLDTEIDVNIKDKAGNTALHLAVVQDNLDIIRLLLGKGSDVNIRNNQGVTPLQYAIDKQADAVINVLLEGGKIDVNTWDINGNTPLHSGVFSANLNLIKLLLAKDADADIPNNDQVTPLHIAVWKKREDIIKLLLLNKRTNVNVRDDEGNTPIHLSLMETSIEACKFNSNRDNSVFNSYKNNKIKPICYNIDDRHIDLGKLFSNQEPEINASSSNINSIKDTEIIYKTEMNQFSIEDESNDDNLNYDDDTISISYTFDGFKEGSSTDEALPSKLTDQNDNAENDVSCLPLIELSKRLLKDMLKRGAIPIPVDNNIPVNVTICIKRKDVSKLLLELKNYGKSYQRILCEYNQDSTNPVIKLFLSADEKHENNRSLYVAPQSEELSSTTNETTTRTTNDKFNVLNVINLFLDNGANLDVQNKTGNAPLHLAVEFQDIEIVKLLLRNKCDINVANRSGIAPLHRAITSVQNVDLIRLLLDEGADVNFRTKNGKTPFQLASETGDLDIVGLLLERGAKASIESAPQNT